MYLKTRKRNDEGANMGMLNDMNRLKTEASATTSELRTFVRGLKGRSPQEVMGIVAGNSLVQALVTATIGCAVMLAVLTIPFAFGSAKGKPKPKPAATAEAEPGKSEESSTKAAASSGDVPSEADLQRASKAMGLDETKTADPKKNPLDSFDNLLDKVK